MSTRDAIANFNKARQQRALAEQQLDEIFGTLAKGASAARGAFTGARAGGWTGALAGAGEGWRQRGAEQQAAAQRAREAVRERFARSREIANVKRAGETARSQAQHAAALQRAGQQAASRAAGDTGPTVGSRLKGAVGRVLSRSVLGRGDAAAMAARAAGAQPQQAQPAAPASAPAAPTPAPSAQAPQAQAPQAQAPQAQAPQAQPQAARKSSRASGKPPTFTGLQRVRRVAQGAGPTVQSAKTLLGRKAQAS